MHECFVARAALARLVPGGASLSATCDNCVCSYIYKMAELDSSARKKDRGVTKEFLLRKVREQSSGIVRGFWLGKLAQLSPFSPREDAIDSHVRTISCHESCLSPSVRALLSRPLVPLSGREGGTFVKADLALNWEEVGAHFAEGEPLVLYVCVREWPQYRASNGRRLSGCVGG